MLHENTEITLRKFDTKIASIREIFLDYNLKIISPLSFIPADQSLNKIELLNSLVTLKLQILEAVDILDLTLTCKTFEFPGFGFLTRLEWLTFSVVHIQRHSYQLKNIYQKLS